jgi:hypothetical protein
VVNEAISPEKAETADRPNSPERAETVVAPVVEEAPEPSIDVSLAAENPDDEKVQYSLPLFSYGSQALGLGLRLSRRGSPRRLSVLNYPCFKSMEVKSVSQQVFLECFQQVLTQICNDDERVLANQPTSPKEAETVVEPCRETSVAHVVEEVTVPSLDVPLAGKNPEEVQNYLSSMSHSTLILNGRFLFRWKENGGKCFTPTFSLLLSAGFGSELRRR